MKFKLLSLCMLTAALLSSCAKTDNTELYQEIKSVDKMVFSSMAITKTAKMESDDWYTIGKRIAVYSYDTYMQAYIDLSALQMDDLVFDESNKTVKVLLPPVKTEVTGRDMEMRKEYENIGNLRDKLDSKERAEIKEKANASFKTEIEENPMFKEQLTEAAKRKARKYFETIFEANGYTASIDFKPSNTESHD
ncbi:MAG: DUF4230 domain-containing protein [Bacteroidales bacterium]|nr:DUF4230 domain-containing protein [Bacteroidales bacterium]MDE6254657.1 DUF4230 domain-containing protein [Muribaculaceae bacterium]